MPNASHANIAFSSVGLQYCLLIKHQFTCEILYLFSLTFSPRKKERRWERERERETICGEGLVVRSTRVRFLECYTNTRNEVIVWILAMFIMRYVKFVEYLGSLITFIAINLHSLRTRHWNMARALNEEYIIYNKGLTSWENERCVRPLNQACNSPTKITHCIRHATKGVLI